MQSTPVQTVGWSPDGTLIATAGEDGLVKLWDVRTGDERTVFTGHEGIVWSVSWSPDGTQLASAGDDGTIRIWDVAKGEEVSDIRSSSAFWHVAWSPDGTQIASTGADGKAQAWDVVSGAENFTLAGLTIDRFKISWSPDGKWLATSGGADSTAGIWAVSFDDLVLSGNTDILDAAWWLPDGNQIVTVDLGTSAATWDAKTGESVYKLTGHTDWVQQAIWSPDGKQIATASWDNHVKIWDTKTGKELLTYTGHDADPQSNFVGRSGVLNLVWSPDGTKIASEGLSGWVRVWRVETGEELFAFRTNEDLSEPMGWSPDGKRIVTCADQNVLQIWDANTGQSIMGGFLNNTTGLSIADWVPGCMSLSWSPLDDRIITTSWRDANAVIWDAGTGEKLLTLIGHTAGVIGSAWSPNGKRIATGDSSGMMKIWDSVTGIELLSFQTTHPYVWTLGWSPDGSRFFATGGLTTAKVIPFWQTTEDLIAYTKECCMVRDLTPEERQQFGVR